MSAKFYFSESALTDVFAYDVMPNASWLGTGGLHWRPFFSWSGNFNFLFLFTAKLGFLLVSLYCLMAKAVLSEALSKGVILVTLD